MMRFLLVNERERFATEFERLKQTPGMSVIEYKEHFTKLSRYASHLVFMETRKVRRFVGDW